MKNPSMFLAFALSLAASAATAQTQPSQGLDPLLESSVAPNKPSMACPAGNETGIVHVTGQKGEFFVDFSATPHRVRKADSGWASLDETSNPTVIAYDAACPPPVMMKSAAGLTNASAAFSLTSFNSPSAAALGLGGGNASRVMANNLAGGAGGSIGSSFVTPAMNGLFGAPAGTPSAGSGNAGLSLDRLHDGMTESLASNFAGTLGANIGREMGPGGFLGQDGAGAAPGATGRLATSVTGAAPPVGSVDGATVQNTASINLTHRGTIRAAASMQATENATFSSGAVTRSATPPDPNSGNPAPQGVVHQAVNE